MSEVVIIGTGAVAQVLGAGSGARMVSSRDFCALPKAELYIVAVTDDAIGRVAATFDFPRGAVVAHTAGGVGIDVLPPKIEHRAVIYPLQSFTKGRKVERFPVFVEGTTPEALRTALRFAGSISSDVIEMDSEKRARLHLAAVFASNFSNAMMAAAADLAADAGVDFDLLRPLVGEVFDKASVMPPLEAQTGPAARGDEATMRRHMEILECGHPELKQIYEKISDYIWRISKKN